MDNYAFEMVINDISVRQMQKEGYVPLTLSTNRGDVQCRYYHSPGEKKAVIFVGGTSGGFDTPAKNLYPKLCRSLREYNISCLRLQYRMPEDLVESALDILAGITFLERFGIEDIGLVGHSFGGAAVIQAAAAAPETVSTVVTISTQAYGAEAVSELTDASILLLHGEKDEVLSPHASTYIHDIAPSEKRLVLYEKAKHNLDEVAKSVHKEIQTWLTTELK